VRKWYCLQAILIVLVIDNDKEVVQQRIKQIMKQLEIWFQANNLVINIKKIIAMSFHFNKSSLVFRP
jgi:hypothetical protein